MLFLITHRMYIVTLILLAVSVVSCDSHSFRVYYIGVSSPGSGLPDFSKVGYVDDQKLWIYSSDLGRTVPVAPWLKNRLPPEFWETATQFGKEDEALFRYEAKIVINRLNHTDGFHFVQVMQSCELRDDGSTAQYEHYRYDGEEFMYLDFQKATYIPTMAVAQIQTQRWNSPDFNKAERNTRYMKFGCIENLKRYIEYGREDLERRVRPLVKVTGQKSGEVTKLQCQVYGFYPRAVDVKWMKNGVDDVPTYETTHVLPNPDGTYQIRVTGEVIAQEEDSYSCYVDHSSLEKPLLVKWEPKQDARLSMIISVGVIAVLVLLTSIIAGVIIYKKRKDEDRADSALEMSFDSDQPITA